MNESVKNVAYYMTLPYTTVLRRDEDDDVIARIEELPGCVAHGSDEAKAIKNLPEPLHLSQILGRTHRGTARLRRTWQRRGKGDQESERDAEALAGGVRGEWSRRSRARA